MVRSELPRTVRAIFVSDLHLGYRISRGERCIDVLDNISAEYIYLVGDIVDEIRLRDSWYWPIGHQAVLDRIVRFKELGAKVFLTPGNHDPCFRNSDPLDTCSSELVRLLAPLTNVEISDSVIHQMQNGQRILVTHGDLFDDTPGKLGAVRAWGARVFDRINWVLPRQAIILIRAFFKLILARPNRIESRVCDAAKADELDGVIFGHLHEPKLERQNQFLVGNCGDWVVNQSFLVETMEGQLELFNFGTKTGQNS